MEEAILLKRTSKSEFSFLSKLHKAVQKLLHFNVYKLLTHCAISSERSQFLLLLEISIASDEVALFLRVVKFE